MNRLMTCMAGVGLLFALGCTSGGASVSDQAPRLYQPKQVEILPFTKVCSFDDDEIPDGVEVVLRPVDAMGDAMKAYGRYHVELHEYQKATAQRAGERLLFWQVQINSVADQRRYWDRITRTYQFRLAWDRPLVPNEKYLLHVTYFPPTGEQGRLYAEHVLDFRVPVDRLREVWRQ